MLAEGPNGSSGANPMPMSTAAMAESKEQARAEKVASRVPPISLGTSLLNLRANNYDEASDDALLDPPSQRDRRRRHHEVANETEQQLRKLLAIT